MRNDDEMMMISAEILPLASVCGLSFSTVPHEIILTLFTHSKHGDGDVQSQQMPSSQQPKLNCGVGSAASLNERVYRLVCCHYRCRCVVSFGSVRDRRLHCSKLLYSHHTMCVGVCWGSVKVVLEC